MKYVPPFGYPDETPYVNVDPQRGIDGSPVPAEAIEHTQREIVHCIKQAGLTPDPADLTQLWKAIKTGVIKSGPDGSTLFSMNGQLVWLPVKRLLEAPLSMWVDANNGSDLNDGLSPDRPLKQVDKAVSWISANLMLGDHVVRIHLAPGTYRETLHLRPYTAGNGHVIIEGAGVGQTRLQSGINNPNEYTHTVASISPGGVYSLRDMTVAAPDGPALMTRPISVSCSHLNLTNVTVESSPVKTDILGLAYGGNLQIWEGCQFNAPHGCEGMLQAINHGSIIIHEDVTLNGTVKKATVLAGEGGLVVRMPGRNPTMHGTVTGKRYWVEYNGIIRTHGIGALCFPGTEEGVSVHGLYE